MSLQKNNNPTEGILEASVASMNINEMSAQKLPSNLPNLQQTNENGDDYDMQQNNILNTNSIENAGDSRS